MTEAESTAGLRAQAAVWRSGKTIVVGVKNGWTSQIYKRQLLLRAETTIQKSDALHVGIIKTRVNTLRRLLDSGANVNAIDFEYFIVEQFAEIVESELYFAVNSESEKSVRSLLKRETHR